MKNPIRQQRLLMKLCGRLVGLLLLACSMPRRCYCMAASLGHNANYNSYSGLSFYHSKNNPPLSAVIPPDFASISFEWSQSEILSGSEAFRTLLNYLRHDNTGQQGINIRVGGDSADRTWWNDNDGPSKKNKSEACQASYSGKYCVYYSMTKDTIRALYDLAKNVNGTLILDLTMMQNHSTTWAVEEAQQILETLQEIDANNFGSILEGFEIGNEPDIFKKGLRAPTYTAQDYVKEYRMYENDLVHKVGDKFPRDKFFRGGGFAYQKEFRDQTGVMIQEYLPHLYSWSFHRYPTLACPGQVPTMAQLLDNKASDGVAKDVAHWASHAVAHNVSYHIGETNSADCGGMLGLSDTMGAALWSLDYMFALAAHGNVSRVNFHGGRNAPYSWIWLNTTTSEVEVKPLYYAMYVWTWIMSSAGPGSRIVPVHCQGSKCGSINQQHQQQNTTGNDDNGINIKTWAVSNTRGHSKVIVINKSLDPHSGPQPIRIRVPHNDGINNQRQHDPLYYWTTLRPHNTTVDKDEDGLYATLLDFSGWTWKGSTHGERQGQFVKVPCHPQQDPKDGFYYCHANLRHATAMIMSLDDGNTADNGEDEDFEAKIK